MDEKYKSIEGQFIGIVAEQLSLHYFKENGFTYCALDPIDKDKVKTPDFLLLSKSNVCSGVEVKFLLGNIKHLSSKLRTANKQLYSFKEKVIHLHVLPGAEKKVVKEIYDIYRHRKMNKKIIVFSCGEVFKVIP